MSISWALPVSQSKGLVLLLNFLPVKVNIIVLSFPFLYSDTENKVQGFLYARWATIF